MIIHLLRDRKVIGIICYITAVSLFALINSILKKLSFDLNPYQIMGYRALISTLIASLVLLCFSSKYPLPKAQKDNYLRAIVELISMPLWILALEHMYISQAVALSFTTPIFSALFAAIFLGDRISKKIIFPTIIALIGALIVLNPKVDEISYFGLLVIVVCICWALGNIFIKKLTIQNQHPMHIVFYNNFFISLIAIPYLLYTGSLPSIDQLLNLFLLAAIGISGHFMLAFAYRETTISTCIPFDYTRLIFSALFAYLLFAEVIKINTIIGSIIIFLSSTFIAIKILKKQT